jgi:3-oxoacyl-[acyl-carrier protein] reductase
VTVDLSGKVVLVTGGGRGIGRATALALAEDGADVAILARSADELDAVAAEIETIGRRVLPVPCDVTGYDACHAAVECVASEYGRLDIVINNAGGGEERKLTLESTPARWAHTIELNLLGVYYVTHAALPHLIAAGGGKIVNVGSGMGHVPTPGNLAYNVAKAGLWMFTQGLATEVWEHGIDVNEVVPGPVLTRLTEDQFAVGAPPPFAPSERVKGPDEVAALIRWLVCQPPGGPTGQSFSLARRPLG